MPTTAAKKKPIAIEDIAATTLRGDGRDFLMGWFRNTPKPWPQMSQAEQANFASAADKQAETLVRAVTNLIGAQGFRSFEVSVGDFQKKGNRLEAKIAAPYSRDNLIEMAEAGESGPIVLSLVSLETYQGERAPAKVMPDQPDLIVEGEDDGEQASDASAANAPMADADLAAGQTVDPETGEIINVAPEDGQRQGEQRLLTYGGERSGQSAEQGEGAGAELAAGHQGEALSQAELDALSPEQRANAERLQGVKTLKPGEAEPIQEGGAPKKRRGRRPTEQRTADNAKAAEAGRML